MGNCVPKEIDWNKEIEEKEPEDNKLEEKKPKENKPLEKSNSVFKDDYSWQAA